MNYVDEVDTAAGAIATIAALSSLYDGKIYRGAS
jgi:hypothetical protein